MVSVWEQLALYFKHYYYYYYLPKNNRKTTVLLCGVEVTLDRRVYS